MPKRKPALKAASASGSQQPTAAAACQPLSIRCTCKSCSYYANVTSRIDRRLVTRSARPAAGSGRCAVCCPRLLAASIQEAEAEWQRARRCAELRKLRRLVWTMRAINTRLDRVTISASPAAEQRPANKRPRA
ncbi:hypothetical protein BOX15_Mlig013271g1 [Macrostomum lignano]|uniref:Uncharacterized protein n=1 Tax=Macrostomum lignano TaxID=282301 RepID=A0A267FG27_9PLAT|nr:hypothetical protein BOX15_Mlig013271g1 [Macrostomum lignano]